MSVQESAPSNMSERVTVPTARLNGWAKGLVIIGLLLLIGLPRFTALNQYVIVDEADRWRWAEDFVYALNQGDLAATLVGDGYPGIVPVWAESLWLFGEAIHRSWGEGQWIGEAGLYNLFHEWDRQEFLYQQRLPIVLLNSLLICAVIGAVWRLFGWRVALVSAILAGLDPFYLSDSRVNRAEAVITGLMTLSILSLIFYQRQRSLKYLILSGVFGGLSLLTKIQALSIAPAIALTGLLIHASAKNQRHSPGIQSTLWIPGLWRSLLTFGAIWIAAAVTTWTALWPAMWVTPWQTLNLVYSYTTRKVGAEGVSLFFGGETFQDADPGLLFYPTVFFMRLSPLVLVGLILGGLAGWQRFRDLTGFQDRFFEPKPLISKMILSLCQYVKPVRSENWSYQAGPVNPTHNPFARPGAAILLIYCLAYALVMSLGSHKQDRYLMPIFLSLDILAALGWVYLWGWLGAIRSKEKEVRSKEGEVRSKEKEVRREGSVQPTKLTSYSLPLAGGLGLALLLLLQIGLIYPHHPYYYSYFNPLLGGGEQAARTLRIGWGEGMDQVGRYLAAKPNSRDLVVSSRFTHNMLGFKGDLISLNNDGRWTQADYIVLYIQQVQRYLDPSPGFIDYFQARPAEQVITIGGIDYAWIYPIPFSVATDPELSRVSGQGALLGYRWEGATLRLFWENLGLLVDRDWVVRLVGPDTATAWTDCPAAPDFAAAAQTGGSYVESLCQPDLSGLPPGNYTVEVGLRSPAGPVEVLPFPAGRLAAKIDSAGQPSDTGDLERLEAVVAEAVPSAALRLDRIYDERLRLVAYQLEPSPPQPGEALRLTLYWQPVSELLRPLTAALQLADSRSISLGRLDVALPVDTWPLGEVVTTPHQFALDPALDSPLAAQLEVTLRNEAAVSLRPTTLTGEPLDQMTARFTVAPPAWPEFDQLIAAGDVTPVEATWQGGITLRGYAVQPMSIQPGVPLRVTLYWQTAQPIAETYVAFVHLLDEQGQIVAQNDALPRAGAYPTPWWQPGVVIEDGHALVLPADLPAGTYRWVVGLYRPEDGIRLTLMDGADSFILGAFDVE